MTGHYILDDKGEAILVDLMTWARWFETANEKRQLAKTPVHEATVSTVFLGLDHNFGTNGPPLLWETMIFGGPHDGYQDRYSTRDEALTGHAKAVELASVEK